MSREIDERVVRMQFENQQFETGVRETRKSLDGLRQALSFNGVTASGLIALGDQVSAISDRFSALGILGTRVLQRIADKAIDTGEKIGKALTIQGAQDGFKEYELKMGSVQTIMNSSGASLEKVNGVLEKLNEYADKTIYSFSDMTTNIGKFTNAGVDLDEAVKAIQGVSNEAALSGANANEASRAMYNFAQALSSGVVRLVDWKSIEYANMATKEFKEELIKTAVELGTVTKEGDKYVSMTTDMNDNVSEAFDAVSKFNDSLSSQWLTSDVLIKTLGRYADQTTALGKRAFAAAQEVKTFSQLLDTLKEAVGSGWAQSFEIIVGDFNEAKALWTDVNNEFSAIVDEQAKKRNELLKGWKDLGGRADIIASFANVWKSLKSAITPVSEAMRTIFPPVTAQNLAMFSARIREITERLTLSTETSEKVKSAFLGVFSVVDMGKDALTAFVNVIRPYFSVLNGVGTKVLDNAAKLGQWVAAVRDSTKESDFFFQKLSGAVTELKRKVSVDLENSGVDWEKYVSEVRERTGDASVTVSDMAGDITKFLRSMTSAGKSTSEQQAVLMDEFGLSAEDAFTVVSEYGSGAITKFWRVLDIVLSRLPEFNGLTDILDKIQNEVSDFSEPLSRAGNFLREFFGSFFDDGKNIDGLELFSKALDKVETGFHYFSSFLSSVKQAVIGFRLSDETVGNLHDTFSGLFSILDLGRQLFDGLFRVLAEHSGTFEDFQNGVFSFAGFLGSVADGVLNVTGWMGRLLTNIAESAKESDFFYEAFGLVADVLGKGTDIFRDFLTFIKNHLPSMGEFRDILNGIKDKAAPLADIFGKAAEAVSGFFGSFQNGEKKLGFFEKFAGFLSTVWGLLVKVGGYIGGAFVNGFAYLSDAVTNMDSSKLLDFVAAGSLFSATGGVVGFIHNLKETVSGFGDILGGVKDVLDGVTGTLEAMQQKVKAHIIATIAGSVVGLAIALAVIAALDTEGLNQALLAIGGLFIYLGGTFAILGKLFDGKNLTGLKTVSSAMEGMAISIAILAASMLMLKEFSWGDISRSLVAVGLLMAGLAATAKILSGNNERMMKGAAGLIFFAAGIRVLTGALAVVKDLSWEELLKGLTAVGLLIAGIAAAINFTNFSGFGVSQGVGLLALAAGIKILTGVVETFAGMETDKLIQGLGSFIATLAALTIALNFMPSNLPLVGLGMMMFATAMLTISGALAILSLLDSDALARGVAVLGISLAAFVIAVALMKTAIPGALAMLVVSAAIAVLVPAMLLLSTISWVGIVKALAALAGIFAVFGVAGLLLAPVVPVILALGGALALIGVATLAAGAGLTMLGVALASLGTGAAVAAASLGAMITIIIVDLIKLIPTVAVAFGRGLIQVIAVLGDGAVAIGIAVIKIGVTILNALEVLIPKVVEVGLSLIVALLRGIAEGIPAIVEAAFAVIISFINALAEAVRGNDGEILAAIGNLISSIIELLLSALQMVVRAVPVFGEQMVSALEDGKKKVREFFTPADFSKYGADAGKALGGSFVGGGKFGDAASEAASDGLAALKSRTVDFEDAGESLSKAFGGAFSGGGNFNEALGGTFSQFGDISPTVRPVIDWSNMDETLGSVDGMFADSTFTFAGYDDMMGELNNLSLGMENYHTDNQNLQLAVDDLHKDNETQNGKLDSMSESMDEYLPYLKDLSKFKDMKVVMDSGELVGVIKEPLNNELGLDTKRSIRSGKF